MKKEGKLNKDQICSVKKITNMVCRDYRYFEENKRIFFKNEEAGFYSISMYRSKTNLVSVEDIEEDSRLICVDKTVLYRPHLKIEMSNGQCINKWFKTEDELDAYYKIKFFKENWLEIYK